MFGYVKIRKGDLRIKEYEFYKAVYCGLCHHQKKLSRRLRYSLSYDMVLLALARMGVLGERASFIRKRCPAHCLKGCLTVDASESLAYTASASAILLYEKLCDDIHDERGIRKLAAKLMRQSARKAMAHAPNPALRLTVKRYLYELDDLEKENCPAFYDVADVFGKLLGAIFAFDENERFSSADQQYLYEIGYRTGRFIYILDAYEDREDDEKQKKYNPFNQSGKNYGENDRQSLITALDMEMVGAAEALAKLHISDEGIHAILENLLTLGLPDVARRIILQPESLTEIQTESDRLR